VDEVVFEWDDVNVDHIARHQFIPDEVDEVFAGSYYISFIAPATSGTWRGARPWMAA